MKIAQLSAIILTNFDRKHYTLHNIKRCYVYIPRTRFHGKAMNKKILFASTIGLSVMAISIARPTLASSFTNGAFESGDFAGWTQGSGYWTGDLSLLTPVNYSVGGTYYDASADASAVVTSGLDPNTDNKLNGVYSGTYSARINNSLNDYSVSLIKQTVTNYTDPNIFFAWAAVLQESHTPTDSDNFVLSLTDDTTGDVVYNVAYNSANTSSIFTKSSTGWFYSDWQVQNLDVSSRMGHDFTLSLLASDCPYGGHAGYVYLDGFGSVIPPGGGGGKTPEPASMAGLLAFGVLGSQLKRNFRKKANVA
jgi:hypothetical protein